MIELKDGRARVTIRPELGGAIERYDLSGAEPLPLFRAEADPDRPGPFALGCNVLIPFSNRIAGGGFRQGGTFHPLPANWPGYELPLHGNGFQEEWSVAEHSDRHAVLRLGSEGPGPFRYDADLTYSLEDGALAMSLSLVNRAAITLPYGGGLHPWFPRTPGTRLQAGVAGVWLADDAAHLPTGHRPVEAVPEWDFRESRPLPSNWINNAFTGWDGRARIVWKDRGVTLDVEAEAPLSTLLVYSPSAASPYFCIEPVSHPVDAHNRRDESAMAGLIDLAPGDALLLHCRFIAG